MSTAEQIEAVATELGLKLKAEFVPQSLSRNAGEKMPMLNWRITLTHGSRPVIKTEYSAGSAHCPGYKQGDRTHARAELVRWECEHGRAGAWIGNGIGHINAKPLEPKFADVLHSLASDADAIDHASFEDWAENLGFDKDSRKAEAIYRACLEIGLALRNALGESGLAKLREACQDY